MSEAKQYSQILKKCLKEGIKIDFKVSPYSSYITTHINNLKKFNQDWYMHNFTRLANNQTDRHFYRVFRNKLNALLDEYGDKSKGFVENVPKSAIPKVETKEPINQ